MSRYRIPCTGGTSTSDLTLHPQCQGHLARVGHLRILELQALYGRVESWPLSASFYRDLILADSPRPPLLNRGARIPKALVRILELGEQDDVGAPRSAAHELASERVDVPGAHQQA